MQDFSIVQANDNYVTNLLRLKWLHDIVPFFTVSASGFYLQGIQNLEYKWYLNPISLQETPTSSETR